MTVVISKKELKKRALEAATAEGFVNVKSWEAEELLIWYKAYLMYTRKKLPARLSNVKVDTK